MIHPYLYSKWWSCFLSFMYYCMIMLILFYHETSFHNYDIQWCQPSDKIFYVTKNKKTKKRTVVSNCSYLIRGKFFWCRSMQVDTQKSCSVLCSNRMQKCKINCYFFLCLVSVQGSHNDTRGGCSNSQRPFDNIPKTAILYPSTQYCREALIESCFVCVLPMSNNILKRSDYHEACMSSLLQNRKFIFSMVLHH